MAAKHKPFVIKKWEAVATWKLGEGMNDKCALCRNKLTEPSIHGYLNPEGNKESKQIAYGQCGHRFHLDCIQRYLKFKGTCPICKKDWVMAKVEDIDGV